MPAILIHRREYSLWTPDGGYRCAVWFEYHFDPAPPGWRTCRVRRSDGEFLHQWQPLAPIEARAPPGARLVERAGPRGPEVRCVWPALPGSYPAEDWGLDAEICGRLAARGEKGWAMATRKKDDGPGLFDGEGVADPGASAYPRAVTPPGRGGAAPRDEAPFPASGEAIDRVDRLEAGIARALGQLRAALEPGQEHRAASARAILEGLLGPAGAGEEAA